IANWMQASYTPKGGLGDIKRSVTGKLGLYNKNDAALPPSYGAFASTYSQLKYGDNRKIELLTSDAIQWSIMANAPIGIPADAICTPNRYYFTLPSLKEHGYADDQPDIRSIEKNPNTKKYPIYVKRNSNGLFEKALFLYPENEFPFIKITKGEYLEQIAAAIERKYVLEKEEAIAKWYTDATRATARKYADDKYRKRVEVLKSNREKYKNELNDVAEIFSSQPDILLENYPDVFTGNGGGGLKLSVYKIDSVKAARCKTDRPQWLTIFWNGGINNTVGNHQHESIINNFNFEFVYNFCFYPEKVKAMPYKPLRSPGYSQPVVVAAASERSRKNSAEANVFFFEDFSTTAVGQKPIGWKAELAPAGTTALTVHPEGLDGSWVELKGHKISATAMKKPLPQDFTLSYDVAVPKNFTWGAKGLTLLLAKETSPGNAESFVKLKLRPGSGGNDGEATLETKFPSPPGYANGTKWYTAAGFSNNKTANRITVTIKKTGERLQVYIDKTRIADYEKAIPSAHLFNALSFDCSGNSADTDKYFISTIRIARE
ncbi:MAG: hypothetical protein H7Y27_08125, partial [Gemmatimonadaceae bacterium]|nr:hypothetical protein [Chitinophagaceae bacterium]